MSKGYASRLSEYPNKGIVGLPEYFDSERIITLKLNQLADWMASAQHLVFLTGAGISTSGGIPDFRGPTGIWTLEKKEKVKDEHQNKKQKLNCDSLSSNAVMDFSKAKPTLTHRAITKLASVGILKYCITQNVDGLHRRSGLSRNHHCALHGCVFTEKCSTCKTEYFGDEDVGGMSSHPTGKVCTNQNCGGKLHDTLLDWEDELPEDDFEIAEKQCDKADLIVCLGTSLRIQPVGRFPLRARKFVIVNLQQTPRDSEASLIIRAPVDKVMDGLLQRLGYSDWRVEPSPEIERKWCR